MGDLSNLRWLRLYDNGLRGTVPASLGSLRNLETLNVGANPLSGQLPESLTQLRQITWLSIWATAVCAPPGDHFVAWLARLETFVGETCNRAPVAAEPISAQTLTAPESLEVSLAPFFADPDDDELAYTAESTQAAPVTAVVSGDTLWLSANGEGEANVAVTACDPDRLCAAQIMQVRVDPAPRASESDREALEALFDATGGDAWAHNRNWKTAAPLGSWYGVTTGRADRVTRLDLRENGLTGAIPAVLRNLDELEELHLGGNSLAGPIPGWLGSMSSLREIRLWRNELTGPVPAELGSATDLRVLDLCCNELTGPLPDALGNLGDLDLLVLSWNRLTGSIPSWVANLRNLRGLWLGGNELSGPVPQGLEALTRLRWLALGSNDLQPGPIPAALGGLVQLEQLFLGGTNRTGPIPPELGDLTNLRILSLGGNGLAGRIPDELGRLTSLTHLYLSGNFGLSGALPPEWRFPDLEQLDISLTQLCAPDAWQEQHETIEFDGSGCGTQNRTIDVAVFYTPSTREAAGGTDAVEAGIDLMIATTNQAFRDSGVATRVALVERSEVPYSETGESIPDIRRLIDPSDGHMDEVHEIRDRVGADLVHLVPASIGRWRPEPRFTARSGFPYGPAGPSLTSWGTTWDSGTTGTSSPRRPCARIRRTGMSTRLD